MTVIKHSEKKRVERERVLKQVLILDIATFKHFCSEPNVKAAGEKRWRENKLFSFLSAPSKKKKKKFCLEILIPPYS